MVNPDCAVSETDLYDRCLQELHKLARQNFLGIGFTHE
jgi:hypothetical protein